MKERPKVKRGIRRTWWKCDGAWNERLVDGCGKPQGGGIYFEVRVDGV